MATTPELETTMTTLQKPETTMATTQEPESSYASIDALVALALLLVVATGVVIMKSPVCRNVKNCFGQNSEETPEPELELSVIPKKATTIQGQKAEYTAIQIKPEDEDVEDVEDKVTAMDETTEKAIAMQEQKAEYTAIQIKPEDEDAEGETTEKDTTIQGQKSKYSAIPSRYKDIKKKK